MKTTVIIANILTLCGSLILTASGLIKNKKRFLTVQCLMCGLFTAGNLLLGGYTGAIVNTVNMARNLLGAKNKYTKSVKTGFVILQIALTVIIGTDSLIMWLPVIGNVIFTWIMDTENMVLLKSVSGGAQLLWAIYDFTIRNYSGVPFDLAAAVTSAIAVIQLCRENKHTES